MYRTVVCNNAGRETAARLFVVGRWRLAKNDGTRPMSGELEDTATIPTANSGRLLLPGYRLVTPHPPTAAASQLQQSNLFSTLRLARLGVFLTSASRAGCVGGRKGDSR